MYAHTVRNSLFLGLITRSNTNTITITITIVFAYSLCARRWSWRLNVETSLEITGLSNSSCSNLIHTIVDASPELVHLSTCEEANKANQEGQNVSLCYLHVFTFLLSDFHREHFIAHKRKLHGVHEVYKQVPNKKNLRICCTPWVWANTLTIESSFKALRYLRCWTPISFFYKHYTAPSNTRALFELENYVGFDQRSPSGSKFPRPGSCCLKSTT